MYTPPPGEAYVEPIILLDGNKLGVVDNFIYLGSKLSNDGSLDAEINNRIAKASVAFGKLEKRVWLDHDITVNTKLSVYSTCVLSSLFYGSKTWTTYRRHIKRLERFHQNCLRGIRKIHWSSFTPETLVLEKARTSSIEKKIILNQMRWLGHVVRIEEDRLPKQLFYGELIIGKRPQHKPKKRFKDVQ